MTLFGDRAMTLQTADGPFRLAGLAVTPDFFETLGACRRAGRRHV
jgi:hypothetical protein